MPFEIENYVHRIGRTCKTGDSHDFHKQDTEREYPYRLEASAA
ncbi:hypothetical protein LINPERPRIM_LOCUS6392 [Linum perenne]